MGKKIIRINKDEIPMLAEMTGVPAEKLEKYAYMFEPGFEQGNIKFWGFVPDEEFLKHIADTIENLGICGPIDITLADAEHYAKLLSGGKTKIEDAIEKEQYIGAKEDVEKFKKHMKEFKTKYAEKNF